jgi:RHS repeat-associated protein
VSRADQLELLPAIYKWDAQTKEHSTVDDNDHLPAGTVLWVRASAGATLHLTGAHTPPTNVPAVSPGFYAVPGLQVLSISNALPGDATLAHFDSATQRWRARIVNELGLSSELLDTLSPGEAIFIHKIVPAELLVADASTDVRYYHADHLDSAAALSDALGRVVEESSFYPFGRGRLEFATNSSGQTYKFSQKERDPESGFQYYESRYLVNDLARFNCVDSLAEKFKADHTTHPQAMNPYSYCHNNPLVFTDPDGRDVRVTTYGENKVLIHVNIEWSGPLATPENIARAKAGIEKAWSGKFGR